MARPVRALLVVLGTCASMSTEGVQRDSEALVSPKLPGGGGRAPHKPDKSPGSPIHSWGLDGCNCDRSGTTEDKSEHDGHGYFHLGECTCTSWVNAKAAHAEAGPPKLITKTHDYIVKYFDTCEHGICGSYDEISAKCDKLWSKKLGKGGLCTYNELCPDGPLKPPVGGRQNDANQWSPIKRPDGLHDWVQIGGREGEMCMSAIDSGYGAAPKWGEVSGENVGHEEWLQIKDMFACCLAVEPKTPSAGGTSEAATTLSLAGQESEQDAEQPDAQKLEAEQDGSDGNSSASGAFDRYIDGGHGTELRQAESIRTATTKHRGRDAPLGTWGGDGRNCRRTGTTLAPEGHDGHSFFFLGECSYKYWSNINRKRAPPEIKAKTYPYIVQYMTACSGGSCGGYLEMESKCKEQWPKRMGMGGLCSYDELCPSGQGAPPMGGQQNNTDQWTPIARSDRQHDWVQIGGSTLGICMSHIDAGLGPAPGWGEHRNIPAGVPDNKGTWGQVKDIFACCLQLPATVA